MVASFTRAFVSCHPDPRDLHSFPTRRSSDLKFKKRETWDLNKVSFTVPFWDIHPIPKRDRKREDRKSTRLNSSHVAISYAVFCLKDKKYVSLRETCGAGTAQPSPHACRYRAL